MQIIYSPNGALVTGITGSYRNPDYFEKADGGAGKVILAGEYANIEQAYQAIGVTVEHYQAEKPKTEAKRKTKEPLKVEN